MSFLRWMTLLSASKIHKDIVLILRREPVIPDVNWAEELDFQMIPSGHNYSLNIDDLGIKTTYLEDFCPDIAELKAPDVQTSDLLIWWILSRYGGSVADMDILFLRPLPEIVCDIQFVRFKVYPQPDYIPVSFIQGKPCSAWAEVFNRAMTLYDPNEYESCGTKALTPCVSLFSSRLGLSERIVFPWAGPDHPWSGWHHWLFGASSWPKVPDECCGIHWYGGRNQRWNQVIKSEKDLGEGAIPYYARKVLANESLGS